MLIFPGGAELAGAAPFLLGCRFVGSSVRRFVGSSGRRVVGSLGRRFVGSSVRGVVGWSGRWFRGLQGRSRRIGGVLFAHVPRRPAASSSLTSRKGLRRPAAPAHGLPAFNIRAGRRRALLEYPGLDGPSRPRRGPRPALRRGVGLDAKSLCSEPAYSRARRAAASRQARWPARVTAAGIGAASMARRCQSPSTTQRAPPPRMLNGSPPCAGTTGWGNPFREVKEEEAAGRRGT